MSKFLGQKPTHDTYWRSIILFGKNTASYKFALAQCLLDFSRQGKIVIPIEDLAVSYSNYLLQHLKITEKQGVFQTSKFLTTLKDYQNGGIVQQKMLEQTIRLGFVNVLDAFHVVNQKEIPIKFFHKLTASKTGIELTDDLFHLGESFQLPNLPHEVEARWSLVENAWSLGMSPRLFCVNYDPDNEILFMQKTAIRRIDVTSCVNALNGYQRGKCFYCHREILTSSCDVDHFFPHVLMSYQLPQKYYLNAVWNLVLACSDCNRGQEGKFALVPDLLYLDRLHERNNYLIESHHPLRETLINQTGATEAERAAFLREMDKIATNVLIHRWKSKNE